MSRAPLRVVHVVGYYADLTGSQRSLLAFLRAADPAALRALVVFPGEGRCVAAYREAGVRVQVMPAPPRLDRFGGAITRAGVVFTTKPTYNQMRFALSEPLPSCIPNK